MMDNNTYPVYSKKQILSDPLSLFDSLPQDSAQRRKDEDKKQLQVLWQQHLTLKQRQKALQFQSKKLSRQIGEAKRSTLQNNNHSIDDLKSAMQLLSQQIKNASQQISDIEQQILVYFQESATSPANTEPQASVFNYGKRNNINAIDIDEISICQLNNDPGAWNDYVENHPAACLHHRSEWLDLFQNSYRHQCFYFAAYDSNNNIVGILPLVRLKSHLFGDLLVSMPYFQRGGAIADHPLIEQKLMQHANQQANELGIEHIEYRDDIPRQDLPVQTHKVNMVLALAKDSDSLWQSFSSKLRAQIKRPQREKPETLFGREELLNAFYSVYSRNMRDLGSPAHSKFFIADILKHFPENSWLVVVKLKQKPVGAALLMAHGDTMEIPLASTIRAVNHLSLNMLLYWEVLQLAIKKDYKFFDFGRSTKDAGTFRFKQQWGAQPQALYWHYWLSEGSTLPELNPNNPKFALLINIWKRLPVVVTNLLGPAIVKYIP